MEKEKGLPEDWRERIRGKKVFFYNTSIGNLLNGGEKHINKIAHVLETFRIHKEVTLWWRPHPLELSTVESMRPELATKYKALRRQYEEEGWGILDTSADVNRAIAISDAYYGDWSSVIELYKVTGKPILLSNDGVEARVDKFCFDIQDFLIIDDNMWFISATMNFLFCMNLETFNVKKIIEIPKGNAFDQYNSCNILYSEGNLVLIPGCGENIFKYSINDQRFDCIKCQRKSHLIKFGGCYIYENTVIAIPMYHDGIIKYKVTNNQVLNEIKLDDDHDKIYSNISCIKDKYIYVVETGTNIVHKINLKNDLVEKIKVGNEKLRFSGIKRIDKDFLITLIDKKELLLWNEEKNFLVSLGFLPEVLYSGKGPFPEIIINGNDVYFFPDLSNSIFKFNIEKKEVWNIISFARNEYDQYYPFFTCTKIYNNKVFAFNFIRNSWITIDLLSNSINEYMMTISEENKKIIFQHSLFEKKTENATFCEQEDRKFFSLDNFIENVSINDKIETNKKEILCGGEIYNISIK